MVLGIFFSLVESNTTHPSDLPVDVQGDSSSLHLPMGIDGSIGRDFQLNIVNSAHVCVAREPITGPFECSLGEWNQVELLLWQWNTLGRAFEPVPLVRFHSVAVLEALPVDVELH